MLDMENDNSIKGGTFSSSVESAELASSTSIQTYFNGRPQELCAVCSSAISSSDFCFFCSNCNKPCHGFGVDSSFPTMYSQNKKVLWKCNLCKAAPSYTTKESDNQSPSKRKSDQESGLQLSDVASSKRFREGQDAEASSMSLPAIAPTAIDTNCPRCSTDTVLSPSVFCGGCISYLHLSCVDDIDSDSWEDTGLEDFLCSQCLRANLGGEVGGNIDGTSSSHTQVRAQCHLGAVATQLPLLQRIGQIQRLRLLKSGASRNHTLVNAQSIVVSTLERKRHILKAVLRWAADHMHVLEKKNSRLSHLQMRGEYPRWMNVKAAKYVAKWKHLAPVAAAPAARAARQASMGSGLTLGGVEMEATALWRMAGLAAAFLTVSCSEKEAEQELQSVAMDLINRLRQVAFKFADVRAVLEHIGKDDWRGWMEPAAKVDDDAHGRGHLQPMGANAFARKTTKEKLPAALTFVSTQEYHLHSEIVALIKDTVSKLLCPPIRVTGPQASHAYIEGRSIELGECTMAGFSSLQCASAPDGGVGGAGEGGRIAEGGLQRGPLRYRSHHWRAIHDPRQAQRKFLAAKTKIPAPAPAPRSAASAPSSHGAAAGAQAPKPRASLSSSVGADSGTNRTAGGDERGTFHSPLPATALGLGLGPSGGGGSNAYTVGSVTGPGVPNSHLDREKFQRELAIERQAGASAGGGAGGQGQGSHARTAGSVHKVAALPVDQARGRGQGGGHAQGQGQLLGHDGLSGASQGEAGDGDARARLVGMTGV